MIVGEALKAWNGSRGAQRDSQRAVEDFALEWGHGPAHRRFGAVMASLPTPVTAEIVAQAACDLFADESWVDALVSALATRMRAVPFFNPPFSYISNDLHAGLLVYEDERISIAAGVTTALQMAAKKNQPRGATSLGFTGQLGVYRFLKA